MYASKVIVDPPTKARIDEKWGTDSATNNAKPITNVLHTARLIVKTEKRVNE
jgi:hypothetical protein